MISEHQAKTFAAHWIAAWNAHDLEAILAHYAEDVEYFSVFLTRLSEHSTGSMTGKEEVRRYLAKGLTAYPDLHFELLQVFQGVRSIVIHYTSVNNLIAAEVFELNDAGLVQRVQCHYAPRS